MTRAARGDGPEVVVVTGASSGIGLATALRFAERGACLVLAARSAESLAEAERRCRAAGAAGTLAVPTDVAHEETVEELARRAAEEFGPVDVWVSSAAVVAYGRFEDVPSEVFRRVVDTNLHGSVHVARAALAQFRTQGWGTLVLVGSLLGEIATPYMGSYVTSKWGVRGLGRVLSIETRSEPDIHVCVVSPGAVDTPVYRQAASYAGHGGRPPPPVDRPEKVARAVVRVVDHPRARVTVGPANRIARLGFAALPAVYDVLVTPMMKAFGLGREHVEPHHGNVLQPQPHGEAVHGEWGRHWMRGAAAGAVGAAAGAAGAAAARVRR